MNLGELALGIDVGTSGVRIAALDAAGKLVADASAPIPPPQREGTSVRQDAEIWWQATLAAFNALHGMVDLSAVAAIAVDSTSGTILPINRDGVPLAQARLYNDASAAGTALRLPAFAPKETAALGATSPLARAIELQAMPGLWKIVHQADWIAGRLSGNFAISDESNALKTGYDPVARRWPDWIAAAGLDPALLPEVCHVGRHTGVIAPQIARDLRLSANTAIIAGATDGCAAFLATGADAPGDGVTSLGSTLTIKLMSRTPLFAPEFGIYSHRLGDRWLAGGASNTGGAVLAAFFPPERMAALEPLLEPQRPTGLDYYPLLGPGERFSGERSAARAPPVAAPGRGSCLPARSPGRDRGDRGARLRPAEPARRHIFAQRQNRRRRGGKRQLDAHPSTAARLASHSGTGIAGGRWRREACMGRHLRRPGAPAGNVALPFASERRISGGGWGG